jgi:hypothetical protein
MLPDKILATSKMGGRAKKDLGPCGVFHVLGFLCFMLHFMYLVLELDIEYKNQ